MKLMSNHAESIVALRSWFSAFARQLIGNVSLPPAAIGAVKKRRREVKEEINNDKKRISLSHQVPGTSGRYLALRTRTA
jgi:hypothetical protein